MSVRAWLAWLGLLLIPIAGCSQQAEPVGPSVPRVPAGGATSSDGPAGGLVFIGAALDDVLRAFDSETGEELWSAPLPGGGQATPMTYRVRPGGRQVVVIAAGGRSQLQTTRGDSLVAFALPTR